MLLGPYRPTKIKIAFNNDTLDKAHLMSALQYWLVRPESTMITVVLRGLESGPCETMITVVNFKLLFTSYLTISQY